jgi:hypothetical protein
VTEVLLVVYLFVGGMWLFIGGLWALVFTAVALGTGSDDDLKDARTLVRWFFCGFIWPIVVARLIYYAAKFALEPQDG